MTTKEMVLAMREIVKVCESSRQCGACPFYAQALEDGERCIMGYPVTTALYGDHLIGMECNPGEEKEGENDQI